jgi:hypothetical protein
MRHTGAWTCRIWVQIRLFFTLSTAAVIVGGLAAWLTVGFLGGALR